MRPSSHGIARPAVVLPVLLGLLLVFAAVPAAAQEKSAYRDHAALTKAVQALAGANKTLVRVGSIGKSRGGRDIWAIEIAGPGAVPPGKRPALLVAAGFEGDDLIGTELALAVAEYLAKNAAADPAVKQQARCLDRLRPSPDQSRRGRRLLRAPQDRAEDQRQPLRRRQRRPGRRGRPRGPQRRRLHHGDEGPGGRRRIHGRSRRAAPDEERPIPRRARRAPSGSLRKGSTTTATASSTRTRRAASTSAGTSPTNIPITRPAPARTWSARPRAGP